MNNDADRGLFITFEGIDGSGKSTQANLLMRKIQDEGFKIVLYREPGGTRISEQIRQILLSMSHREMSALSELFLYSAARAQLTEEMILPALYENDVVICDRYFDSTVAYQGFGRGIDLEFISVLTAQAAKSVLPDITFIVDVSLELAESRTNLIGTKDRLENETSEFKQRVIEGYRYVAENSGERAFLLDGRKSVEEVFKQVWTEVNQKLPVRSREL